MSAGESETHRHLKALALHWALNQGYRIAAPEVSLPDYRFRLDVAAYRPAKLKSTEPATGRIRWRAALGLCAVFECKASRPDFRRDAASFASLESQLRALHTRRLELERLLHLYYPSIRNGDSLFQEFQSVDFSRAGHEEYTKTLQSIGRLTRQLHNNTKFEKLVRWSAANLFYVVADPGTLEPHEIPPGWGLLLRQNEQLEPAIKPLFHSIDEADRLALLHRIATTSTHGLRRQLRPGASSKASTQHNESAGSIEALEPHQPHERSETDPDSNPAGTPPNPDGT